MKYDLETMELTRHRELVSFLTTCFPDLSPEEDLDAASAYAQDASAKVLSQVIAQAKLLLEAAEMPLDEIGAEANRWFATSNEARDWIGNWLGVLETAQASAGSGADAPSVKDSNGAPLSEGDSVITIKDLKVKGGSSDLKRGTLIRKIHLVEDPEVIECRVDGSTLVLKTCFLKKA